MSVMHVGSRKAIVAGLMLATASLVPAYAESRTTSFTTFLHIGPGRQFAVTGEIPTRTTVDVTGCEHNWCQIRYDDALGWIEQRMLVAPAAPTSPAPVFAECADFARTGWPNSGDHERLCIAPPRPAATPQR